MEDELPTRADSPGEEITPVLTEPGSEPVVFDSAGFDEGEVLSELAPGFVPAERVVGWIVTLLIGMTLLAVHLLGRFFDWWPSWTWWPITGLYVLAICFLGWLTHQVPVWTFRNTGYRINFAGLEIKRGIFWKQVVNIPRSRVQHTDVSQGPLQRRHGIASLKVHTAGTENATVALEGVSHEEAMRIRSLLIHTEDDVDGV